MIETPFSSLSPEASRALVDASRLRDVPTGDQIFGQGEVGGSVLLISSGLVAVQMWDAQRQPVTVAMRGPGEMLGEMSLFAKEGRRSATAVARARSRLLELDSEAGQRVRRDHRELDELFLRILTERSAALSRRLAERRSISVEALVAHTLLELPGDPGNSEIAVTHADLAGICGLAIGEVEIALRFLESQQLIDCTEGVKINDRTALANVQ